MLKITSWADGSCPSLSTHILNICEYLPLGHVCYYVGFNSVFALPHNETSYIVMGLSFGLIRLF